MSDSSQQDEYTGFEQGPIRPPSEAASLLIRVTRNCPWNRCTFCPVYKGARFSRRPAAHVKQDIDAVYEQVCAIQSLAGTSESISRIDIDTHVAKLSSESRSAFYAALNWYAGGMRSVFLQDANSLVIDPHELAGILVHLRTRFAWVSRITSYARSGTVARISDNDMKMLAEAGLNRIHIGMESGSDEVLAMVKKGATKEIHVKAGRKVRAAGIGLSEYVMPGLGGKKLSGPHARQTADALNKINPDFIRLRTLAIPQNIPLFDDYSAGRFEKLTDMEAAKEILIFLESLDGITSTIKSDHILNLFEDLEGKFPDDRRKMIGIVKTFLEMPEKRRMLYQVGRRLGYLRGISGLDDPRVVSRIEAVCKRHGITPENVDAFIDEAMKRFI
ncbi:MAG: radical SAM protein [Deltaproteobacteria bacterium]|nr:radical SAM protein [Deltaproteobacteria bacterium]